MVDEASQIKDKILLFLKINGPSLPVHIAGQIKSSILFTSAFLSELVSEKKIRMSNMRVGSSPVYFLPGQEERLENFSQYLRSKEKEAFLLLKEKKFLNDAEQLPAIRVALREIRDFAFPFKSQEKIVWRYFLIPESDFSEKEELKEVKIEKPAEIEIKKGIIAEKKPREKRKASRKLKSQQKEQFFDRIKEFLAGKSMELRDIEGFKKNEIILRVTENGQEKILVAYNKRKITDNDMIKAHKKASEKDLPYIILGMSEPTKKTSELVRAMKGLSSIYGLK